MRLTLILAALVMLMPTTMVAEDDPYLWLEEVEAAEALDWSRDHNAKSTACFTKVPEYEAMLEKITEIYNSQDRIPTTAFLGPFVYNFWQDAEHERGIWRRTTLDS